MPTLPKAKLDLGSRCSSPSEDLGETPAGSSYAVLDRIPLGRSHIESHHEDSEEEKHNMASS
jgi:hypothetical protein